MALIDIYGLAASDVQSLTGSEVYVKRQLSDPWIHVPFVEVSNCSETAAPSVGEATFIYRYGEITRPEFNSVFGQYYPLFANGAHVAIVGWNGYGAWPIWYGIIQNATVKPWANSYPAAGEIAFTAYDLKHLLDRRKLLGSIVTGDSVPQYIPKTLKFNEGIGSGLNTDIRGNRSTNVGANGAHFFSHDPDPEVGSQLWSYFDILNYVLVNFANDGSIIWYADGQTESLRNTYEIVNIEGLTIKQVFDKLVNRRRGLGYTVYTDGYGVVFIYIFSLSPVNLQTENFSLPANWEQYFTSFVGFRDIDASIKFTQLQSYDRIIVRGGPLYVTATFSYADGTLEPGWSIEQETAYNTGSTREDKTEKDDDRERLTDKFANVFTMHNVPANWPGLTGNGTGYTDYYNAIPYVRNDGIVDGNQYPAFYRPTYKFERHLPFKEEALPSGGDLEYRRPFAIVIVEDPDRDGQYLYMLCEACADVELTPARTMVSDSDFAFHVKPRGLPHLYALGTFVPYTDDVPVIAKTAEEPEIDYRTLIFTGMFATDQVLQIDWSLVPPYATEIERTQLITIDDAVGWYIVPGTVEDVKDGALLYADIPTGPTEDEPFKPPGMLRDDSPRLRDAGWLGAVWYGIPRSTIDLSIEGLFFGFPIGSMISAVNMGYGVEFVNTCVTKRTTQFVKNGYTKTILQTQYAELDIRVGA